MAQESSEREERLKVLNEKLHDVEEVVSHWVEKARVLKSERNTFQLISKLSLELLQEIFLLLASDYNFLLKYSYLRPRDRNRWHWLTMTWVCQHWRNAAISTPTLWTNIDKFKNTAKIKAFLERSRNAGLAVRLGGEYHHTPFCTTMRLSKLVLGHIERVTSLSASLYSSSHHSDWIEFHKLFSVDSLLRLKSLQISNEPDNNGTIELPDFDRPQMRLQILHLNGVALPWNHNMSRGLSELNLENLSDSLKPTLSMILIVLEGCPDLQELRLKNAGPMSNSSLNETRPKLVNLLRLRNIDLSGIDLNACECLIDSLEIPVSTVWSIICSDYPFLHPKPVFPKIFDRVSDHTQANVTLTNEFIWFGGKGEGYNDSCMLGFLNDSDLFAEGRIGVLLECVGTILSQQFWRKTKSITLVVNVYKNDDIEGELIESSNWEAFFSGLRRYGHLVLEFRCEASLRLEDNCIRELVRSPGDPPVLQCPELETLNVQGHTLLVDQDHNANDVYLSFVENLKLRKQTGKKLKRLTFVCRMGPNEEVIGQIQDLDLADNICYEFKHDNF